MKYQLLFWTLFGISFGIDFFDNRLSHSTPAPVFEPILTEIRDRLPNNLKLRLPAEVTPTVEETILYSFIPDDDLDLISMGDPTLNAFMVMISEFPDCVDQKNPLDCSIGLVGVSETSSDRDLTVADLPEDLEDLTSVKFGKDAKGFYFVQHEIYQLVIWKQDALAHLLIAETCDDGCVTKTELIEMAHSAANEPAITSSDNSIYDY